MKTKIKIKSILGNVLFEYEKEGNTIKETLEKAIKENADLWDADLSNANLRDADLSNANLRNADLSNANLRNADLSDAKNKDLAIKIPMFCKWSFGISGSKIHIGCEKRSIKEWDNFFDSDNEIETKRGTEDFKQIQAVYNGLKSYYLTLNKKHNE